MYEAITYKNASSNCVSCLRPVVSDWLFIQDVFASLYLWERKTVCQHLALSKAYNLVIYSLCLCVMHVRAMQMLCVCLHTEVGSKVLVDSSVFTLHMIMHRPHVDNLCWNWSSVHAKVVTQLRRKEGKTICATLSSNTQSKYMPFKIGWLIGIHEWLTLWGKLGKTHLCQMTCIKWKWCMFVSTQAEQD